MPTTLKPFFTYYGAKYRAAPHYPKPTHDTIIEPFAGAAGYSVRHYTHSALLYDIDPVICGVWDYLIRTPQSEILNLPLKFDHIEDTNISQEARWLIGFWLNKGTAHPCKKPSAWMRGGTHANSFWGSVIRERIASQVDSIRHWKIYNKSYHDIPETLATWYVDPPYIGKAGKHYRYHDNNYDDLAIWCGSRSGQIIVCEQEGANWLPFKPFRAIKSMGNCRGKGKSMEVIYYLENSIAQIALAA